MSPAQTCPCWRTSSHGKDPTAPLRTRTSNERDRQGPLSCRWSRHLALVLLQRLCFQSQVVNPKSGCGGRLEKGRMSLPSWCPHKPLPALQQLVLAQSQAWICACLHGMCVRTKQGSPKARPAPNPGTSPTEMGTRAGNSGCVLRAACGPVPGLALSPCASPAPATLPAWPTPHWAGAAAHGDTTHRMGARTLLEPPAGVWKGSLALPRVTVATHSPGWDPPGQGSDKWTHRTGLEALERPPVGQGGSSQHRSGAKSVLC